MSASSIIQPSILDKYIPATSLAYGSFSSTESQLVLGSNIPTDLSCNITEIAQYTYMYGTKLYVLRTGIYVFNYSIQLDKIGAGASPCEIFIKINNNFVPRSGGRIIVAGNNGETLPFAEYTISLNAGDYITVSFVSSDATMIASYFPETVGQYPDIPSVILNIRQIS